MSWRKDVSRRFVLWSLIAGLSAVAWFATGCTQDDSQIVAGRESPLGRVVALQKGKSTRKDVEDLLGPPFRKDKSGERKERWRYFMRKETVNRVFFIPYKKDNIQKELIVNFHGAFLDTYDKNIEFYTSD